LNIAPVEMISTGHGLLEGPLWDGALGLIVADAVVGGVWSISPERDSTIVVPHRRGIGGLALHEEGAVVIGGRNIAVKWPEGSGRGETVVLLNNDPANDIVGFNDFTTDDAGRIYVGSLAFVAMDADRGGKAGKLHVIDLDGSSRVVADDILLSNGLGFSPDGRILYQSDSLRRLVYAYEVDVNGDLRDKRTFVALREGMPDGLAVDQAGNVWVAAPYEGAVQIYSPAAQLISQVKIPVPMVTSLCFGGADLRDVFIVSGSEKLESDRGAGVYRTRSEVAGLPRPLARVRLGNGR
jgi:gluconolactonase